MTARAPIRHRAFSFGRIGAIASNTLLELVRMKVFYFMLLFALLMIGSSAFMVQFTFQEQFQVLKDVSLGAMSIFTWLLAVLSTAMLLPKDVEDRTLYTILAKPVPRFEYLLGKLLGVLALLAIAIAAMSALFLLVLYTREQTVLAETRMSTSPELLEGALRGIRTSALNWNLLPGIIIIYLKAALCASFTLLLSTFASSSIFTIMISVMVYFIGHLQGVARGVWLEANNAGTLTKVFLGLVAIAFPDLQIFNVIDDVVVGTAVTKAIFLQTAGLGVLYTAVYLLVGYLLFAWKEL